MPDIASSIKFSSLERDPEVTMPPPKMTTDWKSVRLFPIPSIIYLIHNNVQFATLAYVDTSTYQIMGNLKIVTTGILFRYMIEGCDSLFSGPIQGYMFGILSACLSALAGINTEFLMKNDDTLYWRNVYSTSMAMPLTTVLSLFLFDFTPTLQGPASGVCANYLKVGETQLCQVLLFVGSSITPRVQGLVVMAPLCGMMKTLAVKAKSENSVCGAISGILPKG
uniref:Uncharacterized protein n=1 Tax=Quercus lobata TaxID=97700 RepID=A0A7N2MTT1_QUELO